MTAALTCFPKSGLSLYAFYGKMGMKKRKTLPGTDAVHYSILSNAYNISGVLYSI
ncbi:hypothetical protein MH928_01480 [Flavobacterium sp. WW92]|uniref:hypothetical protein n=1 Tax=unclassified Flavobacterium TaxID=196869 RepID=UPI002224BD54|nr:MULTISPECIES: hypothetical protein [unclassified Flavobacterium]WDO13387.1 hypothetical protein MH928_01480 [Flavobacterium sp. WW92]